MDGFHFDDAVLVTRGWRPRKGAPHTFDVNGFLSVLDRLRANQEDEIAVPVFFREEEIAHNAARMIARQVGILIVEGNYLLLDQDPWTALRFDTTIYLDVPKAELRRRLEDRWQDRRRVAGEDGRKRYAECRTCAVLPAARRFHHSEHLASLRHPACVKRMVFDQRQCDGPVLVRRSVTRRDKL